MKKNLCGLLIFLLVCLSAGVSVKAEETGVKDGFRAVWVSSVINLDYPSKKGITTDEMKKEADTIINRASELGMTAIILQVRPTSDALYKSDIYPWSEYLTGTQGVAPSGGFDPLAYWVEKAHEKGLELHAWINPYRVTHTTSKITDVNKLSINNPARQNPAWVVTYNNALYFDPGLPECRKLIVDGIVEIVKNYDVDGIHLDDYFYPGTDFADNTSYAKYGAGMNRDDWRRENVNKVIKAIQTAIKETDPSVRFGVSPFAIWQNSSSTPLGSDTKGFESYKSIYSDSRKWVKEGWMDYICPQIYWSIGYTTADYQKVLNWWVDVCEGTSVDLYVGHAAYKEAEGQSGWQGEILRQLRLNDTKEAVKGSVFFRIGFLNGNLGNQIKNYYQNNQSEPVVLMDKLTVVQPSSNTSVTSGAGYTIFGTCDPGKVLYMNGQIVTNVSAEGFFSVYAPLVKGDNVFTFTQEKQTAVTRTITLKDTATTPLATMSAPAITGAFPSADEYVSMGDTVTFKCTAPAGAKVTVGFNGQTFSLTDDNPNRSYGSDTSKIYSTTYSYRHKIESGGNTSIVSGLGTAVYSMTYKNQAYKQTSSGTVLLIGKNAPYYATVTAASAWLYPQGTTNGGSSWQLLKGQKDKVTALTSDGKWVRLSSGKWIEKQDVSVALEKNFITDALSNGRYIATASNDTVVWTALDYSAVDTSFDGKSLNVYFGMQSAIPKVELPANGSAIFTSITTGTQNGIPYCTFTLKDGANIEGFYTEYLNGELRLVIKKRKSLTAGDMPLTGFTFVIDPGHGQSDSGARGPMGNTWAEKDINLANAKKLSERLKKLGATVVMTRETDVFLTLYERTELSRRINPDMFISMHANSVAETTDSTNIRGFTVWYRNSGSVPLADSFAKNLANINPLTTRKQVSYQSNLYVVRPSWTPSLIIEASYMCNISDFAWLINEARQNEFADGMAEAILKYYVK